jgi:hypothetical protein
MTWDAVLKAITPSVQSAVYALLAMLIGAGGTYAVNREKPAVAASVAPQACVAAMPSKTPQSDQTKLQLVGVQDTLNLIAKTVHEINTKDCVARPMKAAAKAK